MTKSRRSATTFWRPMTNSEIEAFKNEARNYRFYQKQIAELQEQANMIYDILGGYKSPDPAKIPGSYNPNMNIQKAELSDKLVAIQRRQEGYISRVQAINAVLDQVPYEVRQYIVEIYFNRKSYIQVADSIPISNAGLYKRINSALKKTSYVVSK